jgi:putative addiction module component (TIGR02574 family)
VASEQGLQYYLYLGPAMESTAISEPPGFSNLSKVEQVHYLQALWDRIAENPSEVPVPEAHFEVAKQRLAEYRRNPDQARPVYDILDRLGKKTR